MPAALQHFIVRWIAAAAALMSHFIVFLPGFGLHTDGNAPKLYKGAGTIDGSISTNLHRGTSMHERDRDIDARAIKTAASDAAKALLDVGMGSACCFSV